MSDSDSRSREVTNFLCTFYRETKAFFKRVAPEAPEIYMINLLAAIKITANGNTLRAANALRAAIWGESTITFNQPEKADTNAFCKHLHDTGAFWPPCPSTQHILDVVKCIESNLDVLLEGIAILES